MNPSEVLRIVDAIHRDKKIDKEIVFAGIEAALLSAAKRHYGDDAEIEIHIQRETGELRGTCNGEPLDPGEIAERIGAQTAKQVMIQKIREAERDALYDEYAEMMGQLVNGTIQRYEGGAATVSLTNTEAILPKGEQIPGEVLHVNDRIRALVADVRKQGSRVKVILSRTRRQVVQRLFEQEIPEVADGVIEVKAVAREPGNRTKVAVSTTDPRVDPVGACVGVRGNRIKNIVEELAGERIDIVPWHDDFMILIPNALQPAEVEEVILCQMLGRAIVLVREDQLSLAIGRRGQNVRLASKLCGWDIEIMTREELEQQLEAALVGFSSIEGVGEELADRLVGEGFLSYDDLSVIEPDDLMAMGGLAPEQVDRIVSEAESRAAQAERAAEQERRRQQQRRREMAEATPDGGEAPAESASEPETVMPDLPAMEASAAESDSDDSSQSDDGSETAYASESQIVPTAEESESQPAES